MDRHISLSKKEPLHYSLYEEKKYTSDNGILQAKIHDQIY
jgi:hypothetical protein